MKFKDLHPMEGKLTNQPDPEHGGTTKSYYIPVDWSDGPLGSSDEDGPFDLMEVRYPQESE